MHSASLLGLIYVGRGEEVVELKATFASLYAISGGKICPGGISPPFLATQKVMSALHRCDKMPEHTENEAQIM